MKGFTSMKTIIIGAGAAGLAAGIQAARNKSEVIIIEHEKQAGKKILITGNGRCNISNEKLDSSMYYGDTGFINCVLKKYPVAKIKDFFESIGLYTCSKNGYIYPMSLQAGSVLTSLRNAALELGVKIKTNNEVHKIRLKNDRFLVDIGIELECDQLILATGGCSFKKTGSDGSGYKLAEELHHAVISPEPALTALICNDSLLNKASGIRIHASVTVQGQKHTGDLQITEYGVSGIPVFNISRLVTPGDTIQIDFMPDFSEEQLYEMIVHLMVNGKEKSIDIVLNGLFPDKISVLFTTKLNIHNQTCYTIDENKIRELIKTVKNYTVLVQKRRGFEFAQVTAGGVSTDEINPETMESKKINNLFFAGEIINVDGICGGYNLHFAWASGMIAGGNCK